MSDISIEQSLKRESINDEIYFQQNILCLDELDESDIINVGLLKQFCGNDVIYGRPIDNDVIDTRSIG